MKVHILTPFATDKNLGRAYNEAISLIPEDDFVCLTDTDVIFLTPDCGNILYQYATDNPDALMTCFTNRVSLDSKMQLLQGKLDTRRDIAVHIDIANRQKRRIPQVTPITCNISGMLMLFSKKLWNEHKFSEDLKCLGVDTDYGQRVRAAGVPILRMDGMYVFHIYRILTGIHDKKHLL